MIEKKSRVLASCLAGLGVLTLGLWAWSAGGPKAELQKALKDTWIVGDWNYDDIGRGRIRAAREDKPVLVVFR